MKRRVFIAAANLALATAAFAAETDEGTPVRGGQLTTILNPEPGLLVLGLNNQAPTLLLGGKIYQGLLQYSADLKPRPSLASSWERSADGKVYTFRLEKNVKFHDGAPFGAKDVIFSIMEFHMQANPRSKEVFKIIQKAEAPDNHTVVFTLREPFEPFILMFDSGSAAIVPSHIYKGTDFRKNPANATPIGTGPFKFKEWVKGSHVQLVRNEQYWRKGLPYLDGIVYRIIPDSQSRALALESGDVQLSQANDIEPFDVPRFKSNPKFVVSDGGNEMISPVVYLDINHRVKPLNDPRFRRAMQHAVDGKFMVDKLWFGIGKAATSPIASSTLYYDNAVGVARFDPKKAEEILDEMGLKRGADGVRTKIRLLAMPYGEVWTRAAEYIKQALGKVGIQITLETTDPGTWVQRLGNWDYDLTFNWPYQWGDPTLGVSRIYTSDNIKKVPFSNTGGYSNPKVDELFSKAAEATDKSIRKKYFSEVQSLLLADNAYVYLFELRFPTIHDKRLKNVISSATGVNASFDEVYFQK